jgi:hypothetical protein
MINKDRIVPVTATDLITLYGTTLKIASVSATAVSSENAEGDFVIAEGGTLLADEPVKSVKFGEGVSSATLYFVASYDYEGFKGVTATGDVDADGCTLYTATLSGGSVTIAKVGF